jgi:GDPmannose 4,6-dehydratase
MYLMLQQDEPDDFVIGTGTSHSVGDFVKAAFATVGITDWKEYVDIDPRYYRPSEVDNLIADTRKAKEKLGWEPKVTFDLLVKKMMKHDLEKAGLHDHADEIKI